MPAVEDYSSASLIQTRKRTQFVVILLSLVIVAHFASVAPVILLRNVSVYFNQDLGHQWLWAMIGPFVGLVFGAYLCYLMWEFPKTYRGAFIQGGADGFGITNPGAIKDMMKSHEEKEPAVYEIYKELRYDLRHYRDRIFRTYYATIAYLISFIPALGGSGALFVFSIISLIGCDNEPLCNADPLSKRIHVYWIWVFTWLFALELLLLIWGIYIITRFIRHVATISDTTVGETVGASKRKNRNLSSEARSILLDDNQSAEMVDSDYSESQMPIGQEDQPSSVVGTNNQYASNLYNRDQSVSDSVNDTSNDTSKIFWD